MAAHRTLLIAIVKSSSISTNVQMEVSQYLLSFFGILHRSLTTAFHTHRLFANGSTVRLKRGWYGRLPITAQNSYFCLLAEYGGAVRIRVEI